MPVDVGQKKKKEALLRRVLIFPLSEAANVGRRQESGTGMGNGAGKEWFAKDRGISLFGGFRISDSRPAGIGGTKSRRILERCNIRLSSADRFGGG